MLSTRLELHSREGGTVRVATLAGAARCRADCTADCGVCKGAGPAGSHLFLAASLGPVVLVQRLTRDQAVELVDVLEEWLFDTSAEGSRRAV